MFADLAGGQLAGALSGVAALLTVAVLWQKQRNEQRRAEAARADAELDRERREELERRRLEMEHRRDVKLAELELAGEHNADNANRLAVLTEAVDAGTELRQFLAAQLEATRIEAGQDRDRHARDIAALRELHAGELAEVRLALRACEERDHDKETRIGLLTVEVARLSARTP